MKTIHCIIGMILIANTILLNATDKQVLVVSMALPSEDAIIQKIIDHVNTIEGVSDVYMNVNNHNSVTDFTVYDTALITERGGSSARQHLRIRDGRYLLSTSRPIHFIREYTPCSTGMIQHFSLRVKPLTCYRVSTG